ncbi:hypothetical protein LX36DRAFT_738559, partial [Colletotrichum falcatum]
QHACRSTISPLQTPGAHVAFSAGCHHRMWQHIIRNLLDPTTAPWRKWCRLTREMHLVSEDGSSWSATWDRVVLRRVQEEAVVRHTRDAVGHGLVREVHGCRVWED